MILISSVKFAIAWGWSKLYVSGPLEITNMAVAAMMYVFARWVGIPTDDHRDLLEFLLFNIALYELGAFCYVAYADRVVYPEVYETSEPASGTKPLREVFLRGSSLPVHQIDYIAAQDDGVIAARATETVFIPRPFGLVVFELPIDLGFQIHRSLWVSRDLAMNFIKEGKRFFVRLPDGRRFPVARSRQREYQAWLAQVQKRHSVKA